VLAPERFAVGQKVDARIISATNRDLIADVTAGRFREDLFYRLHVISIQLPPLKDRKDDIPLLTLHFLGKYAAENRKGDLELTPDALDLLTEYDWPGNVRELENVVERAVVLSTGESLDVDLLPSSVRHPETVGFFAPSLPANGISFKEAVSDYERQLIVKALQTCGGVQKKAAEMLRVKPTTLHEMMKRLNISSESVVSV